jgi:hypothetical protein
LLKNKYILLTIDVEDWFQVENFKPWIPFETWDQRELRVERNVHRLLDLFDSVELKNQAAQGSRLKAQSNDDWDQNIISPANTIIPVNSDNPINRISQASSIQPPNFPASQHSSFPASQHPTERCPKATFFVLAWIAEKVPHLIREVHARGHEVASHGCNHQLSNQLSPKALTTELDDSLQ